jgi:hypothetical protein
MKSLPGEDVRLFVMAYARDRRDRRPASPWIAHCNTLQAAEIALVIAI